MDNSPQNIALISELLALEVTDVKINRENEVVIKVDSTKKEIPCHRCGQPTELHGKGRTLHLRHLSILGKRTVIEITPPRGICKNCDNNPTTTQTLSWFNRNGHQTKFYEEHIVFSLINSTTSDVSIKEDVGEGVIQAIIDRTINDKITWNKIKAIGLIGIDEISLKKGHQDYVTIITSRVESRIRILAVIKGREKAEIKAFFSSIPHKNRKTIIAICCDLYEGFMNAAQEVFGASVPIVSDRFHVAKLYRKCLVELRKKELVRLRKTLSDEAYSKLKSAIVVLMHNKEFISKDDKEELEKLFNYSPLLKVAYRFCKKLTILFNTNHRKSTAEIKIKEWIEEVESSELVCFDRFIKTLKKYYHEITNYFISRDSSGFVEGFNNKIKVIKRRCYGIFNLKHLFQRIFLDSVGYEFFKRNQSIATAF